MWITLWRSCVHIHSAFELASHHSQDAVALNPLILFLPAGCLPDLHAVLSMISL